MFTKSLQEYYAISSQLKQPNTAAQALMLFRPKGVMCSPIDYRTFELDSGDYIILENTAMGNHRIVNSSLKSADDNFDRALYQPIPLTDYINDIRHSYITHEMISVEDTMLVFRILKSRVDKKDNVYVFRDTTQVIGLDMDLVAGEFTEGLQSALDFEDALVDCRETKKFGTHIDFQLAPVVTNGLYSDMNRISGCSKSVIQMVMGAMNTVNVLSDESTSMQVIRAIFRQIY